MGILQAETLAFHIVMHNLRMPVESQAVHIVVVRGCMFEVHWCGDGAHFKIACWNLSISHRSGARWNF